MRIGGDLTTLCQPVLVIVRMLFNMIQFGRPKRAFSACGPNIWNSLPPAVRNIDSHPAFRRALKSHLFQCAFIV